jgi:methylated-DNA-[protein]-cysteine S-methyltransferase
LAGVGVTRVAYEADGWGIGELWSDHGRLLQLEHPAPGGRPHGEHPLVPRLQAYFAGDRVSFSDVTLELGWCTELQLALATALRRVPWGEVVTYGELAALAGRPRAARAAGAFCAQSRFAVVIPCHRVVSADGLGGYGSLGLGYKRRLLALEGVEL